MNMDGELNPNHKVTRQMHDQWYKICAMLVRKFGDHDGTLVKLTKGDIDLLVMPGGCNMVIKSDDDAITLRIVPDEEAVRLAKREGGLPV